MSARYPRRLTDLPPKIGKAKVKLGIRNTTDTEFAAIVRNMVAQLDDNPDFPDPMPAQDLMKEVLAAFTGAITEAASLRSATMAANSRKAELRAQLAKLTSMRGNYLNMVCGGSAALIQSAGAQVCNAPTPSGELPPPACLACQLNGVAGTMLLSWQAVDGALTYLLQQAIITSDMKPEDYPWTAIKTCTTRKVTLDSLNIGQTYAHRVAAIGGKTGQSPWSPPVTRTAG